MAPGKSFVVISEDSSMTGGMVPVREGELMLMEWIDTFTAKTLSGQVCMVQKHGSDGSYSYVLRRLVKDREKWLLQADSPISAEEVNYGDIRPLARFIEGVHAEE